MFLCSFFDEILFILFLLNHEKTRIDTFKKAINYILNNFDELSTFTNNPMLPIYNNIAERTISNLVLARKKFQIISIVESAEKIFSYFQLLRRQNITSLTLKNV